MNEKQNISSEEVGSLEDVLGKNDPIFRPVLEPEPEQGLPWPIDFRTPEGIKVFYDFKAREK